MRVDKFPTAALELEDGKKASYKQYISSFLNSDCTKALLRIAPRIDMEKICRIVDDLSIDDINIDDLELSVRSYNCLKRAKINTVVQLKGMSDEEFQKAGIRCKSYEEIKKKLEQLESD